MYDYLVGGLDHFFKYFSIYGGHVIIPTDFHSIIFQRGRGQPPTSYGFDGIFPVPPNLMVENLVSSFLRAFGGRCTTEVGGGTMEKVVP